MIHVTRMNESRHTYTVMKSLQHKGAEQSRANTLDLKQYAQEACIGRSGAPPVLNYGARKKTAQGHEVKIRIMLYRYSGTLDTHLILLRIDILDSRTYRSSRICTYTDCAGPRGWYHVIQIF